MAKESWKILSEILSDETVRGEERLRRVRQELGGQQIWIPPLYYEERYDTIRKLKAQGKTITEIAREFNLSVSQCSCASLYES